MLLVLTPAQRFGPRRFCWLDRRHRSPPVGAGFGWKDLCMWTNMTAKEFRCFAPALEIIFKCLQMLLFWKPKAELNPELWSFVTSFRPGSSLVSQAPRLPLPMAAYDEDILKNPFYVALEKQRPDLCRRAAEHQGVVSPALISPKVDWLTALRQVSCRWFQCFNLTCHQDYGIDSRFKPNVLQQRCVAELLLFLVKLLFCFSALFGFL